VRIRQESERWMNTPKAIWKKLTNFRKTRGKENRRHSRLNGKKTGGKKDNRREKRAERQTFGKGRKEKNVVSSKAKNR